MDYQAVGRLRMVKTEPSAEVGGDRGTAPECLLDVEQ